MTRVVRRPRTANAAGRAGRRPSTADTTDFVCAPRQTANVIGSVCRCPSTTANTIAGSFCRRQSPSNPVDFGGYRPGCCHSGRRRIPAGLRCRSAAVTSTFPPTRSPTVRRRHIIPCSVHRAVADSTKLQEVRWEEERDLKCCVYFNSGAITSYSDYRL